MDVHAMLRQAVHNGWDGIENAGKNAAEYAARENGVLQERIDREAKIVKAAMATPEGAALVDLIITHVFRSPTAQQYEVRTADEFLITRARREGAQGVAYYLLNLGRGEAAPAPEGGTT